MPVMPEPRSASAPIVRLEDLKKVFQTDEVETHAVADVQLEIPAASTCASPAPAPRS